MHICTGMCRRGLLLCLLSVSLVLGTGAWRWGTALACLRRTVITLGAPQCTGHSVSCASADAHEWFCPCAVAQTPNPTQIANGELQGGLHAFVASGIVLCCAAFDMA